MNAPSRASGLAPAPPHTLADDLQAGISSVVMVSLGLALLNSAGLVTGGTPGLAFLLSYTTGAPLGAALFVVNVPFYVLGWRCLGWRFTLKTLLAVSALSLGVEFVRYALSVSAQPMYASIAGGVLIGTGLLVMFRHKASFGGINILALYLQRRFGWPTGKVQLFVDFAILVMAFGVVAPDRWAWSIASCLAVNTVLVWNHRPGRYITG